MRISVVTVADKEPSIDYLAMGWKSFNKSLEWSKYTPVVLGWGLN